MATTACYEENVSGLFRFCHINMIANMTVLFCQNSIAFLHCQAGTVAAWHTLQFHCLACVKPRGFNPPSPRSWLSWFIGIGGSTHGEYISLE